MGKQNIEAIYALSPQQQGMLFETLFTSESGIYIEQEVHTLRGDVNFSAFQRAWQHILDRHSILRTAFVWKDQDEPLQVMLQRVEVPLEWQDWRGLPSSEQQEQLEAYLISVRRRGFELSRAPLMRLALFQTGERAYQFIWTQHHILMDGWCRPVIFNEFNSLYQAFSSGKDVQLEPSRPYRDYVAWLKQQDLAKAETFWRTTLQGFRKPTSLGVEGDPGKFFRQEERYGNQETRLSTTATATLQSLARRHHLTLNTLVQGAWALLLCRYSGEEEVVFGTTVSGRPPDLEGVESMIGLFINTLPFRVKIFFEASLWSWLKDIQAQHFELRDYEYCSTGQVHQWSEVPGSLPLYESLLVFENYPDLSMQKTPSVSSDIPNARGIGARTNYTLTVLVTAGSELFLHVIYDGRRLDSANITRVLEHFLTLLKSMALDRDQHLKTLLDSIPADQIPSICPLQKSDRQKRVGAFVAPRTPTEEMLTRMWSEVLGLERISINDNFFDLGGHSLLAMQLASRVRNSFKMELPLRRLFEAPTLAELAVVIEEILIDEIEELSESEARRLVGEEH